MVKVTIQKKTNPEKISQTYKNDELREITGKLVNWQIKNEFLKKEIAKLEKGKDFPIFSIAAFLLKSQLVEFELKQLITSLDQHIYFSNPSKLLNKKTRTPKYLDDKLTTLGKLKNIINEFEGEFLMALQIELPALVNVRNDFVHGLFNLGTIDELVKKSEEGITITNALIVDIEKVEEFLKKNNPLKKNEK